jgi:pilus assembly protein FimV
VDQLLDNPLYLAGGAAVLALLGFGGYTILKRRRGGAESTPVKDRKGGKKNPQAPVEDDVTTEIPSGAGLAAGKSGGDVHEEGDPLAEAEIFLTYGRDNLAEERLKEAIAATPKRYELHAKLLEIYANRRDAAAFEQVAKELQSGTGSKGELWNKAVKLGYQIDPENTRYAAGRPLVDDGTATVVVGGGSALAAAAAAAATAMGTSRPGGSADAAKTNLDFNLGFDDSAIGTTTDIDLGRLGPEIEAATTTSTDIDLGALGETTDLTESVILDPGAKLPGVDNESTVQITAFEGTAPLPTESETAPVPGAGLDFDFDVSASAPAGAAGASAAADSPDDGGLNFDISGLNLDLPMSAGGAPGSAAAPDLDLSGISLDLGSAETAAPAAGGKDDKWYDVQTKFDLAKAYQEMGDREGAREILQEVLAEGDAEQKAAAQAVLGSLG